jgi:hypothetical protein
MLCMYFKCKKFRQLCGVIRAVQQKQITTSSYETKYTHFFIFNVKTHGFSFFTFLHLSFI